jgi:hypothetical protein
MLKNSIKNGLNYDVMMKIRFVTPFWKQPVFQTAIVHGTHLCETYLLLHDSRVPVPCTNAIASSEPEIKGNQASVLEIGPHGNSFQYSSPIYAYCGTGLGATQSKASN